mgnify:CR=1 FL=1
MAAVDLATHQDMEAVLAELQSQRAAGAARLPWWRLALRPLLGLGVDVISEQVRLEVDLDDFGQMGVGHLVKETCFGPRVAELASPLFLTGVLSIELVRSAGGRVETAEYVHKSRLTRTRRTHDGQEFTLANGKRNAF